MEEKVLVITALIERAEPVANFLAAATGRREYVFLWPDMVAVEKIIGEYPIIYIDADLGKLIPKIVFWAKNIDQSKKVYIIKIQPVPKGQAIISPGTIIPLKISFN
ncbi:MAG: hypothetical protein PHW15_01480 [Patescibacteria group bacterium]|nr:hypothetical protein [Patescibacteria group bacterium]MDD5173060.1 hypothetical protein [Patescibacteria group bacterium]